MRQRRLLQPHRPHQQRQFLPPLWQRLRPPQPLSPLPPCPRTSPARPLPACHTPAPRCANSPANSVCRSIVITSNRVVQDWGKYLGDATMATTILDRLMHRCAMLEFEGKSYRLKEAAARIAITPESS